MFTSLGLFITVFTALAIMPFIGNLSTSSIFYITVGLALISGTSSGNYQKAVYGLASKFPGIYMAAVVSGQGLAGIIAALVSLFTKLLVRDDMSLTEKNFSGSMYFIVTVSFMILSTVSYVMLRKIPLYKKYANNDMDTPKNISYSKLTSSKDELKSEDAKNEYLAIFKSMWLFAFSIFIIGLLKLALYSHIYLVKSSNIPENNPESASMFLRKLFTDFNFLLFNIIDLIAKFFPGWSPFIIKNNKVIHILSTLRLLMIPLIMICNVHLPRHENHFPILIKSDVGFAFIVLLCAAGNGYLGSLLMVKAPMIMAPSQREKTGAIMAMFLNVGLAVGAFVSFGLKAIHGQCSPF